MRNKEDVKASAVSVRQMRKIDTTHVKKEQGEKDRCDDYQHSSSL